MPQSASPARPRRTLEQRHHCLSLKMKVELDGTVPFRRSSDMLVPPGAGVYLLHDLRGVLYVGRTCSLRRRFEEHELNPTNPLIAQARKHAVGPLSFSWILLADPKRLRAVEAELINALDPPCNRCFPSNGN